MNGKEIERIDTTFRFELELAMKPIRKSMESFDVVLIEHGEDIVAHGKDIGQLQEDAENLTAKKSSISSKALLLVLALPTGVLATIAVLNYLDGVI